ncbi:MAG: tetratricopeptide repeat protein [Bacteroidia bacterium]|nr:tetratricopeptide repeat protein [Bacteroidia bacterium]
MLKRIFTLLMALAFAGCERSPESSVMRSEVLHAYTAATEYRYSNYDSLLVWSIRLDSLTSNGTAEEKAMSAVIKGAWLHSQAKYFQAKQLYKTVLAGLNQSTNDTLKGRIETGLGIVFRQTGQMDSAFLHFYRALRLFERAGNTEGRSGTAVSLAQTYQQTGQYDTARALIRSVLGSGDRIHYTTQLIAMHTLANIYGEMGLIDSALRIDKLGLKICDDLNKPVIASTFYDNKGLCFRELGIYDSSAYYFRKCILIDSAAGNVKQTGDSYLNLASLASARKDFVTAEKYLQRALSLCRSCNYTAGVTSAWSMMSDLYRMNNDPAAALAYKDSLYSDYRRANKRDRQAMILELEAVYNAELKDNQIDLQNEQLERKSYFIAALILLSITVLATAVAVLYRFRIRRQEEKRMLELKAAAAFYEAEQQERLRIARDLHDSLGQILSATKMVLGSVNEQADNKSALHKTTALVDSAISEVRSISYNLLPDALQFGVEKALLNLARKLSGETGIEIACEISNSTQSKIPSDVVSLSIYRIAQEVLSNMLKHSQCSMISIKSGYVDTTFVLEIKDNGRGFDSSEIPVREGGSGWINIRARTALIEGKLAIISHPGAGTSITLSVPLK